MKNIDLSAAFLTEKGPNASKNEDACICQVAETGDCFAGIFAVADGVGSALSPEVASALAIDKIRYWWEEEFWVNSFDESKMRESLALKLEEINRDLFARRLADGRHLSTTLSVLLIFKNKYYIFHVGDSRIYHYKNGLSEQICLLTDDHLCNAVQEVGGKFHMRRVLSQSLGNRAEYVMHTCTGRLGVGDAFMVCSDGCYKKLSMSELQAGIKNPQVAPEAQCRSLLSLARQRGELDDVSIVLVKASEDGFAL